MPDAPVLLASALDPAHGRPAFALPLDPADMRDGGVAVMAEYEARFGGFEYATRRFVLEHLEPGDALVDVGAHFGLYSLTAATAPAAAQEPGVTVVAVEPHPDNLARLGRALAHNNCAERVRVIQAALAAEAGRGRLLQGSTMGHMLEGSAADNPVHKDRPPLDVAVTTLDALDADPANGLDAARRVFVKIDVEGLEAEVLRGGRALLASGRVAAVIWEKGRALAGEPPPGALTDILDLLAGHGLDHWRFPSDHLGGPLVPYVPGPDCCNVVSLAQGFERRRVYAKPWGPWPATPDSLRPAQTSAQRAAHTRRLMAAKGTDAGRWTDWSGLATGGNVGADVRAGMAASGMGRPVSVLDLGAGTMALPLFLPRECAVTPVDLVARSRDCLVGDFNQGMFPKGKRQWAAALHVCEFVHDVPRLLAAARQTASRLALSYHTVDAAPRGRRERGWFNDFSADDLRRLLADAGWRIERAARSGAETFFWCA